MKHENNTHICLLLIFICGCQLTDFKCKIGPLEI